LYRNQFVPLLQQKFIRFDFFLADRGIPYLFLEQSAFFFFLLIAQKKETKKRAGKTNCSARFAIPRTSCRTTGFYLSLCLVAFS
jgi:hypothetical protein